MRVCYSSCCALCVFVFERGGSLHPARGSLFSVVLHVYMYQPTPPIPPNTNSEEEEEEEEEEEAEGAEGYLRVDDSQPRAWPLPQRANSRTRAVCGFVGMACGVLVWVMPLS